MRRARLWLTLCCALAWTSPAAAQSSQDRALAESLFRDAKELVKKGAYDAACPKFAESQRLDPQLGTLLHLATCHEQQGKTASAWAEYSEAAERAAARGDARAELARERADALESQLARLRIVLEQPADALEIEVDGVRIGSATLASAFPVDPGAHTITARRPGGDRWQEQVRVPAGPGVLDVAVPLLPETPGDGSPADDGAALRTAGWIAGGVGVAGIAVMSIFGIVAAAQASSADESCDGRYCTREGLDGHADARTSAAVSTVGLVVGIAGLATGAVLLLVAPSPNDDQAAYWVGPSLGPGGGMLRAGLTW